MYWLGVDVGTGGSRALLIDARGREVAAVTSPHEEMRMDHPLWAEQRPENWADASVQAIRGALAQARISGDQVRGVGLSGQMHGLVILDASNQSDSSLHAPSGAISAASRKSTSSTA